MGENADEIINGICCSLCGLYFYNDESNTDDDMHYEHGYPVACKKCWTEDCGYEKALPDTF